MIQDILPYQLNNQFDPQAVPAGKDTLLCIEGSKLLVRTDENTGEILFPTVEEFEEGSRGVYLFSVSGERFFLLPGTERIPQGYAYAEIMALRRMGLKPKYRIFAALTGKHLADWYRDARFCGRCGQPMNHSEKERAMACPSCRNTVYPRIMPAVIVGVKNGNKLLLTKYRVGYGHNALIAGFTEIGETLEETVAREVMEEAGIRVKNIRYYKSQPWGIANDILVGYYCEVDGDTQIHMDSQELKYAEWVERGEIELQPDNFSLTNEMMCRFKEGIE